MTVTDLSKQLDEVGVGLVLAASNLTTPPIDANVPSVINDAS